MRAPQTVIVRVRETTRGAAGVATVAWSVIAAATLFAYRANYAPGTWGVVGVLATALLGAYLGWRRRLGVMFLAPLVSWCFAWLPLIIGEMIRDGFLKGFFLGLVWATVGWIPIGAAEFIVLAFAALPFRLWIHHRDGGALIIENPFRS